MNQLLQNCYCKTVKYKPAFVWLIKIVWATVRLTLQTRIFFIWVSIWQQYSSGWYAVPHAFTVWWLVLVNKYLILKSNTEIMSVPAFIDITEAEQVRTFINNNMKCTDKEHPYCCLKI